MGLKIKSLSISTIEKSDNSDESQEMDSSPEKEDITKRLTQDDDSDSDQSDEAPKPTKDNTPVKINPFEDWIYFESLPQDELIERMWKLSWNNSTHPFIVSFK